MRISRTLPALAALVFATACSSGAPDVLAPDAALTSTSDERGGLGMSGSGNAMSSGTQQIESASSNTAPGDSTSTGRGVGWIGSGN